VEISKEDQLTSCVKGATDQEGCRSSERVKIDKVSVVVIKGNMGNHGCGD